MNASADLERHLESPQRRQRILEGSEGPDGDMPEIKEGTTVSGRRIAQQIYIDTAGTLGGQMNSVLLTICNDIGENGLYVSSMCDMFSRLNSACILVRKSFLFSCTVLVFWFWEMNENEYVTCSTTWYLYSSGRHLIHTKHLPK